MIKIRLMSDELEEITTAVQLFERLFPTMRFSVPRLGGNPKYKDDPKYLSYGEPRVSKGKRRNPNFTTRLKNIKKK